MSVSKATVLDAFGWFKDLLDVEIQKRIDEIPYYEIPTASKWVKGGVKIGDGLEMSGDTLICTISSGTLDLVTQTDNGLMRATDKVKLDGIADNAQENIIENISIDDNIQNITGKTAQLDLSAYAKKDELTNVVGSISSLALGDENVIEAIWLDGTPQLVEGKIAKLEMSAYAKKSDIASGMNVKGSVNSFADLPTNAEVGDLYNVKNAGGVDGEGVEIQAGDNVVFTVDGKWDVMAGLIDLSGYVEKVTGKQLSTNDFTNEEKNKLEVLNNYELPTASETVKGGVKIGDGLSMDGDTLNVTVKGETYSEFTGATASAGGSKGLVPAPASGDNKNFLCGNGTWADPSRFVTVVISGNGTGSATSSSVANIQGGLWQDLINGVPCLKLRYGDYEYNFLYDTMTRVGGADTPLDTSNKGIAYTLSTVPSSQDGNLWYEVNDTVPTLMFHKGAYNYGYNYNTITYKGSNSYLWSYMPFESTVADALSNVTWTATDNPTVEFSPLGSKALRNTGGLKRSTTLAATFTLDFWFYVDLDKFPSSGSVNYDLFSIPFAGNSFNLKLTVKNRILYCTGAGDFEIPNISKKRTHFAITHINGSSASPKVASIYIDGKFQKDTTKTWYPSSIQIFPTASTAYPAYIDHFRIFKDQIVWAENFTPPTTEDYLK